MPGGMPSSRETHVFGVRVSQRIPTPRTTICSTGAKRCQGSPRGSGYPGAEPHPVLQHCSGRADSCFLQCNQGIRIFLLMPVAVHGNTIPVAPTARHRCHCCGAFPFPEGQDIPCPQGHGGIAVPYQASHGSWITAMWIHADPVFPASDPVLALWALQGTPLPPSAHSSGWRSGKQGRMIPRKEWGEGGS